MRGEWNDKNDTESRCKELCAEIRSRAKVKRIRWLLSDGLRCAGTFSAADHLNCWHFSRQIVFFSSKKSGIVFGFESRPKKNFRRSHQECGELVCHLRDCLHSDWFYEQSATHFGPSRLSKIFELEYLLTRRFKRWIVAFVDLETAQVIIHSPLFRLKIPALSGYSTVLPWTRELHSVLSM